MRRFLALFLFCTLTSAAHAGDEGLYPDAIDPEAGFLRVLAMDEGFVNVAGKSRRIKVHGLSDFLILPSGRTEVAWSKGQAWVDVMPGRHVNLVIATDGTSQLYEEPIANQPAKADVTLINISDLSDVVLFVPQAKQDVFTDLAQDQQATRAIKAPLTLDFEFRASGKTWASLTDVRLLRKSGVTFLLTGAAGDYTALAMPNRYER